MNKQFIRAALVRAIKTVCQTLIGCISASALLSEVDWIAALSAAGLAGLLSLLTSVATGLPEVEETK